MLKSYTDLFQQPVCSKLFNLTLCFDTYSQGSQKENEQLLTTVCQKWTTTPTETSYDQWLESIKVTEDKEV